MLQVTCAIIVRDELVLGAQRSATMRKPLKWEFPGGKIEPGETLEDCIRRELKEELGIEVELLWRGPDFPYPIDQPDIALLPFVVRITGGILHPAEHAELRWCTREELPHLDWAEADVPVLEWWLTQSNRS